MQEPHRQHPEVNTTHEARLIYKDVEKPAENPAEKATRTWLDRLKYSLDFAMPISPIKPSFAINTAEKLAGLKQKTAAEVKTEEEQAAEGTMAAAAEQAVIPPIDTEKTETAVVPEEEGFWKHNTERVKQWVNGLNPGRMVLYGTLTAGGLGILYYLFNRKKEGTTKSGLWKNILLSIPIVGLAYYLWPKIKAVGHAGTEMAKFTANPIGYLADKLTNGGEKDPNAPPPDPNAPPKTFFGWISSFFTNPDEKQENEFMRIVNAAGAPGRGIVEGIKDTKERIADTFGENVKGLKDALAKCGDDPDAVFETCIGYGLWMAFFDGIPYIGKGALYTAVSMNASLIGAFGKFLWHHNLESGGDLVEVYFQGGVGYVTSIGAIQFLANIKGKGIKGSAMKVLGNAAGWPFFAPYRLYRGGKGTVNTVTGMIFWGVNFKEVKTVQIGQMASWPSRKLLSMKHGIIGKSLGARWTEQELLQLKKYLDDTQHWHTECSRLRGQPMTAQLRAEIEKTEAVFAKALEQYYDQTKNIPSFVKDPDLIEQIKAKRINNAHFRIILGKSSGTGELKNLLGVASPASRPTSSVGSPSTPANAANAEQATPTVASSTEEVFDEATGRFMSAETAAQLDEMRAIDSSVVTADIVDEAAESRYLDDLHESAIAFLKRSRQLFMRISMMSSAEDATELRQEVETLRNRLKQLTRHANEFSARSNAMRTSQKGKEVMKMIGVEETTMTWFDHRLNQWSAVGDVSVTSGGAHATAAAEAVTPAHPPGPRVISSPSDPPVISAGAYPTDGTGALSPEPLSDAALVPEQPTLRTIIEPDGSRRFVLIDAATNRVMPPESLRMNDDLVQIYGASQEAFAKEGLSKIQMKKKQIQAIWDAHDKIRPLYPKGQGYNGSGYAKEQLIEMRNTLDDVQIPREHQAALFKWHVCGDDVADVLFALHTNAPGAKASSWGMDAADSLDDALENTTITPSDSSAHVHGGDVEGVKGATTVTPSETTTVVHNAGVFDDAAGGVTTTEAVRTVNTASEAVGTAEDVLRTSDLPRSVQKIIVKNVQSATEAQKAMDGISALAKIGIGVDALLVAYEGYMVVQLWQEVGRLAELGGQEALIKKASEAKKSTAIAHTQSFAVDVAASYVGAALTFPAVVPGSAQLVVVAGATGGLALIAIPVGMAIRAGMIESLNEMNMHEEFKLKDRIEGLDEVIVAKSKFDQLYQLGDPSAVQWFGTLFNKAKYEDMKKYNLGEREEIILAMVYRGLRDLYPDKYAALLAKLAEERSANESVDALRHHRLSRQILIPYLSRSFVGHGRSHLRGRMNRTDMKQLEVFNIDRDGIMTKSFNEPNKVRHLMETRLTEERVNQIAAGGVQLVLEWLEKGDEVGEWNEIKQGRIVQERRVALRQQAEGRVKDAFGSFGEKILSMTKEQLITLRKRHAEVFVDLNYYFHSSLEGLRKYRENNEQSGYTFAPKQTEDIAALNERLAALNEYLQLQHAVPKLIIEAQIPEGVDRGMSPETAFHKVGDYEVNDRIAANLQKKFSTHSSGGVGAAPRVFEEAHSTRDLHQASLQPEQKWLEGARRKYEQLLLEFREGGGTNG